MESNQEATSSTNNLASPSSSAGSSSLALKIKEEPIERDDWQDSTSSRPNSVPTALVQPEPVQKHQRLRYYGRKHVASPDTAVCEVCQGEFRGPDVLQIHKLCHFNTSHVCYVCDCYFPNTEVLVLHMATNHRNLSTTTGNYKPEAERSFVCVICLQRFSSNKMLMKHQKCHTEKDSTNNACKICALDFIGSKALLAHLSSPRHKEMKVKIQSIFVCVDCRSIFATRDSYAMHMMMRAQSETCDKMEEEDDEPEPPEKKVMDLLRNSVSENVSAIATSMAMTAMAANGLFFNNIVDMQTNRKSTSEQAAVLPFLNNNAPSPVDTTSVPLNLSTTLKPARLECTSCFASFPSEDSLQMHKTMMHRQDSSSTRRNPTVSDLLRAQQQLQQSNRSYFPTSHGFIPASSAWTCVACGYDLDSCDSLAMHMMEKHANQDDNSPLIQMPDARLIQQKVQQVYAEASAMQLNPAAPPQNTAAPVESSVQPDIRSQSTGVMDDINKKLNTIKPEKRRLSLQEDTTCKRSKTDRFGAICTNCQQCFSNKDLFFCHIYKCIPDRSFNAQCSFCKEKYESKDELIEHVQRCGNFSACSLCGEAFHDQQLLLQHYKSEHLKTDDNNKIGDGFECKQCHLILSDLPSLMKHARSHDNESSSGAIRGCPLCGWSTSDAQLYVQHMLLHNVNLEELDLADGRPNRDITNGGILADAKKEESSFPSVNNRQDTDIRRSRRKPLASAKVVPSTNSPDSNEFNHVWSESGSECSTPLPRPSPSSRHTRQNGIASAGDNSAGNSSSNGGGLILSGAEDLTGEQLLGFLMDNVGMLTMCKHCKIIFTDRTMYHLHMGLHNRNDPWQCNLCGKACKDVHEFSSHVIHY